MLILLKSFGLLVFVYLIRLPLATAPLLVGLTLLVVSLLLASLCLGTSTSTPPYLPSLGHWNHCQLLCRYSIECLINSTRENVTAMMCHTMSCLSIVILLEMGQEEYTDLGLSPL